MGVRRSKTSVYSLTYVMLKLCPVFCTLSRTWLSLDWFIVCGKPGSRRDTPVQDVRADATNSLKIQCFCIRLDKLYASRASNQTKSQIESTHTVVQDMMVRVTNQTLCEPNQHTSITSVGSANHKTLFEAVSLYFRGNFVSLCLSQAIYNNLLILISRFKLHPDAVYNPYACNSLNPTDVENLRDQICPFF